MITPTIHLGGSPGQQLLDEKLEVIESLRKVHAALVAASPNGRDYPAARVFAEACGEHRAHYALIATMLHDFESLAEDIQAQIDAIHAQKRGR